MSKICTTIEQSQKLIELGLDVNTADMCYRIVAYNPTDEHVYQPYCFIGTLSSDIPAWSLTALLEVMPIYIAKDGMEYKLKVYPSGLFSTHSDTSKWTLQYCGIDYSYRSRDKYPRLVAVTQHNLITAAYEMVCWLLENKKI